MAADTRDRLLTATLEILRTSGLTAISARSVATRAGVNQALVFYHFDSVSGLVSHACRHSADEAAQSYRAELAAVTSLSALLDFGRRMHARERAAGSVTVMAQVMAGAHDDPALAAATRYALRRWHDEIRPAVERALAGTILEPLVDIDQLTRALSSSFVGLALYDTVDPDGATEAFVAWEQLGVLAQAVDGLGPTATRLLRRRLTRPSAGDTRAETPHRAT